MLVIRGNAPRVDNATGGQCTMTANDTTISVYVNDPIQGDLVWAYGHLWEVDAVIQDRRGSITLFGKSAPRIVYRVRSVKDHPSQEALKGTNYYNPRSSDLAHGFGAFHWSTMRVEAERANEINRAVEARVQGHFQILSQEGGLTPEMAAADLNSMEWMARRRMKPPELLDGFTALNPPPPDLSPAAPHWREVVEPMASRSEVLAMLHAGHLARSKTPFMVDSRYRGPWVYSVEGKDQGVES